MVTNPSSFHPFHLSCVDWTTSSFCHPEHLSTEPLRLCADLDHTQCIMGYDTLFFLALQAVSPVRYFAPSWFWATAARGDDDVVLIRGLTTVVVRVTLGRAALTPYKQQSHCECVGDPWAALLPLHNGNTAWGRPPHLTPHLTPHLCLLPCQRCMTRSASLSRRPAQTLVPPGNLTVFSLWGRERVGVPEGNGGRGG